jgi:hypothetical protein
MSEHDFSSLQRRKAILYADEKAQYASSLEEHVLRSISARAPLPKVLNEICSVLDCQIGNVVSLISFRGMMQEILRPLRGMQRFLACTLFVRKVCLARVTSCLGSWRCTTALREARMPANFSSSNEQCASPQLQSNAIMRRAFKEISACAAPC